MKLHCSTWVFFLSLLSLLSCVTPISVDLEEESEVQLAVEGWVNTLDEVSIVRLRTVSSFNEPEVNSLGVNARVVLETSLGESVLFKEVRPGVYHTDTAALIGRVGESYTLSIDLANGESYISSVETIPEPVDISAPRAEYSQVRSISDERIPFINHSHKVYASLENTPQDHFVKVEAAGWWRVQVAYGLCGSFDATGGPAGPAICWARRNPIIPEIITTNNQGLSGDQYEILAVDIPFDFRDKYVVDLSANAMSPTAFSYWETAKTQLDRGGGIFDPPFASVVGNIRNVNDPSESVLGYFHAYAKTTSRLCFDRAGTPAFVLVPGILCEVTCIEHWRPAAFQPPFNPDDICP